VDSDRQLEVNSPRSSKSVKTGKNVCDVSRAAKTSDWWSCSVEYGLQGESSTLAARPWQSHRHSRIH